MKRLIFALAVMMTLFGCSDEEEKSILPGNEPEIDEGGSNGNEYVGEPIPDEHYLGALFSFDQDVRRGNIGGEGVYNVPLFKTQIDETTTDFTESDKEWWDNIVEELAASGVDFVAADCHGYLPDKVGGSKDYGDPTKLAELVAAMERRGVADQLKIAIFDNSPSSWDASRNWDMNDWWTNSTADNIYPLDNLDAIYKYIWDYNLKAAFKTVPEKYWFRFMNRPVIFFWGANKFLFGDRHGEVRALMLKIRKDFKSEFGCEPYMIVDKSFLERDRSLFYRTDVDAEINWYTMNTPYNVHEWYSGAKIGMGVPAFWKGNDQLDANHGEQLISTLSNTIGAEAHISLINGFTNGKENAALYRSSDHDFYDYPNQRINIMRRFSKNPYPVDLKIEAEACDSYNDLTEGNSGTYFREGDLDINQCNDEFGGWCVVNTSAGEWMEWKELPFRAQTTTIALRYQSTADAKVRFDIDETAMNEFSLPSTNGMWTTINAATTDFVENGLHTVKLNIVAGTPDINYFTIINNFK